MPSKKYFTDEERRLAARQAHKRWKQTDKGKQAVARIKKNTISKGDKARHDAIYYQRNKEYIRKQQQQYKSENQDIVSISEVKRRVSTHNATPNWLSDYELFFIKEVYSLAKLRSLVTNTPWEVDHIAPLQGKTVCGLHTPWNLQVIRQTSNRQKQNKLGAT